jgi:hypothetical protein
MPDTDLAGRLAAIRRAVAAEFARLDAHQWGYDHGFSDDPDACEETTSFVDAAIAVMQPELDRAEAERDAARADAQQLRDAIRRGLADVAGCCSECDAAANVIRDHINPHLTDPKETPDDAR